MKSSNNMTGHLAATVSILIWGTTFISTKVLLRDFQPVELLFFRFVIGFTALFLANPHRMKTAGMRQELAFAGAGLCGVTLYFMLENVALSYTLASNVGVIISAAPFFTAILSQLVYRGEEKLGIRFLSGFLLAMVGICLISFQGASLEVNPLGDLLTVGAAFAWACYSVIMKKISAFGYSTIQITRRIFAYGILFMVPALFLFDFRLDLGRFADPVYLCNILFLGLGASALCFVTWNYAVKVLGVMKTSVYIYVTPVVTVIASVLVLHERITAMAALGTVLTLAGLVVSESRFAQSGKTDTQDENGSSRN